MESKLQNLYSKLQAAIMLFCIRLRGVIFPEILMAGRLSVLLGLNLSTEVYVAN